jgi:PAS domain S-box-containing protein
MIQPALATASPVDSTESRIRLEAMLQAAPAFIIAVTRDGRIEYINRLLPQYRLSDVIGGSWLQYFAPERRVTMTAALERVYNTGSTETFEVSTPGPDGGERFFSTLLGPIRDRAEVVGAVLVSQDVTEQKRAQLELVASRHLALLGTLAAGVAHEINTPIQFVGDSLHFLRDAANDLLGLVDQLQRLRTRALTGDDLAGVIAAARTAEEHADLDYLRNNMPAAFERCADGLARVATIVRSLKEFAHPAEKDMKAVDLNRVIDSALTIARGEYKYVADLETELGALPPVTCHSSELGQAILNVVVNAAHAIGDTVQGTERRGRIRVQTRQEGDCAVISISDTGTGIPEAIRGRIFDPFFTTKEVGRGTGQGLAIAWKTVTEQHGGQLTFDTKAGEGTTFFIRVPLAGKPPR